MWHEEFQRFLYGISEESVLDKVTLASLRDIFKFVFQKIILAILWRIEWKGNTGRRKEVGWVFQQSIWEKQYYPLFKSMDFDSGLPKFEHSIVHLLAVWLWANKLIFLFQLSYQNSYLGIIIALGSRVLFRNKWVNVP